MADNAVLTANKRAEKGSRAAQRLRNAGRVPAVIYGHKEEAVPLAVERTEIEALLRHGVHSLLNLDIDGQRESAIIKDMQWDVFGREILHVDFARVSKDEKITVEVGIVLKGVAPGVAEGGAISQPLHNIEIRCSADNIPEQIVVNVSQLHLGQELLVKDLELPAGAEAITDGEQLVVQVSTPTDRGEAATEAETTAEPELIRREKEDEGDGKE